MYTGSGHGSLVILKGVAFHGLHKSWGNFVKNLNLKLNAEKIPSITGHNLVYNTFSANMNRPLEIPRECTKELLMQHFRRLPLHRVFEIASELHLRLCNFYNIRLFATLYITL